MSKSARKNRSNPVTYDETEDVPKLVLLPVPHNVPAKKKSRVIISRPADPDPIRRVCVWCGATFDDHTGQPNTLYCRNSCKQRMSERKRDRAVALFSSIIGSDDLAWSSYANDGGLPALEKRLVALGYRFDHQAKEWVKS